jgi:hypothetical protein
LLFCRGWLIIAGYYNNPWKSGKKIENIDTLSNKGALILKKYQNNRLTKVFEAV